jgi:hypothetical protein
MYFRIQIMMWIHNIWKFPGYDVITVMKYHNQNTKKVIAIDIMPGCLELKKQYIYGLGNAQWKHINYEEKKLTIYTMALAEVLLSVDNSVVILYNRDIWQYNNCGSIKTELIVDNDMVRGSFACDTCPMKHWIQLYDIYLDYCNWFDRNWPVWSRWFNHSSRLTHGDLTQLDIFTLQIGERKIPGR